MLTPYQQWFVNSKFGSDLVWETFKAALIVQEAVLWLVLCVGTLAPVCTANLLCWSASLYSGASKGTSKVNL